MAVDRKILQQALSGANAYDSDASMLRNLQDAQGIQQTSLNSENFGGGRAGGVGLASQLGTAAIGAYSRYKAERSIADKEVAAQEAFASKYPQFADLASQLSPATREAYVLEDLKSRLPKASENQIISGDSGYYAVDKNNPNSQAQPIIGPNGQVIRPQKPASTTVNVGEQQGFKNETQLRGEFSDKSKNFIGVKENYEKTKESLADPSPAGDISTVFAFMKTLDPQSTVREGEFAQLSNAKPLLEKYGLQSFENAWSGKRLTPSQREDIAARSQKLYDRAALGQKKTERQYEAIAKRNGLNPENIIIDSSTTIDQSADPAQNQKAAQSKGAFKFLGFE